MDNIKITQEISIERVQDLLCNALEGGSNYWYVISRYLYPLNQNGTIKTKESLNIKFEHIELPFKGGHIVFEDLEDPKNNGKINMYLGLQSIEQGLQIMANKFPKHFMDFICENDDAETGDVFLQCCLFGDVIYG